MRFDRWISVALTFCAAAMAAAMVRREFFPPRTLAPPDAASREPTLVAGWAEVLSAGVALGDSLAPITLVEFGDLECPFCRQFHLVTLPAILERFPRVVSPMFVLFPLSQHRFAGPAASAAECAGQQNAFGAFVQAVFQKQDSLGLRFWTEFALDAGVQDTVSFAECIRSHGPFPRIEAGREAATRFGVRGTPGVMLNGWLFPAPPSIDRLSNMIEKLLAEQQTSASK